MLTWCGLFKVGFAKRVRAASTMIIISSISPKDLYLRPGLIYFSIKVGKRFENCKINGMVISFALSWLAAFLFRSGLLHLKTKRAPNRNIINRQIITLFTLRPKAYFMGSGLLQLDIKKEGDWNINFLHQITTFVSLIETFLTTYRPLQTDLASHQYGERRQKLLLSLIHI